MSEKELGKALLRGEDPIDLEALTQQVLRRDRRRMWSLGMACVASWMLVVALPWGTLLPMMAKIGEHLRTIQSTSTPTTAAEQAQALELAQAVKVGTIATFLGSMGSMFVAAICTVWFIIASRRATLRQVNARLAEISAQLKVLAERSK